MDADTVFGTFQREVPRQMKRRRLGRRAERGPFRGRQRVSEPMKTMLPSATRTQVRERGACGEEVALGKNRLVLAPQVHGSLLEGGGRCDPGIRDHNINSAEGADRSGEGFGNRCLVCHVHPARHDAIRPMGGAQLLMPVCEPLFVDVGKHDAGAISREPPRAGVADAAGAPGDQSYLPGERLRRGHFSATWPLPEPSIRCETPPPPAAPYSDPASAHRASH